MVIVERVAVMTDDRDKSSAYDWSPGAALAGALSRLREIEDLRTQLAASREHIEDLRKRLVDQTGKEIAEKSFGYTEPLPVTGWIYDNDPLPATALARFKKTNTEIIQCAILLTNELVDSYVDSPELEWQTKKRLMDELFCELQKRGFFRHFQRKTEHETIYTIAIEVAKP